MFCKRPIPNYVDVPRVVSDVTRAIGGHFAILCSLNFCSVWISKFIVERDSSSSVPLSSLWSRCWITTSSPKHQPDLISCSNLIHHFFITFITFLYMFRATLCSSSGGFFVYIQHLVLCMSLFLGDRSVHRQLEDTNCLYTEQYLRRVTYKEPDDVCIQRILLMMSTILLETFRGSW